MENLMNVLFKFGLGSNILRIERINSGHINKTYKTVSYTHLTLPTNSLV